jgi:hypothetical protein
MGDKFSGEAQVIGNKQNLPAAGSLLSTFHPPLSAKIIYLTKRTQFSSKIAYFELKRE